jgi:hypothetical protein
MKCQLQNICTSKIVQQPNRSQYIVIYLESVPVQEVSVPVQEVSVPVQEVSVPVQKVSVPVQKVSVPVQEVPVPVQEVPVPVQEVSVPVQKWYIRPQDRLLRHLIILIIIPASPRQQKLSLKKHLFLGY